MTERSQHAGPRPEESALLSAADSASVALSVPGAGSATEPGAPAALYLASLTDGPGRRGMQRALAIATHVFSDGKTTDWTTLPWAHIRYRHLEALRTRLREQYAPATVNLVLSAVRGVLRAAFADGAISAADYLRIKMVKGVEAHRQPSGRSLDAGEARALFRACTAKRTPSGTRDAAAFALMYGAGLRRAEAAALDLADYNPDTGALRVIGKGDKERTAYAGKGGMDAFDDWLEIRGDDPGPFLVPVDHVGARHRPAHDPAGPHVSPPAPERAGRNRAVLPARPPPLVRLQPPRRRPRPRHRPEARGTRLAGHDGSL